MPKMTFKLCIRALITNLKVGCPRLSFHEQSGNKDSGSKLFQLRKRRAKRRVLRKMVVLVPTKMCKPPHLIKQNLHLENSPQFPKNIS